jgi:hypothetical protein
MLFPEMVDTAVVRYSGRPRNEPAVICIMPFLQGIDDLDKGFLENILCQVPVFYQQHDSGKDLVFMPVNKPGESAVVS